MDGMGGEEWMEWNGWIEMSGVTPPPKIDASGTQGENIFNHKLE